MWIRRKLRKASLVLLLILHLTLLFQFVLPASADSMMPELRLPWVYGSHNINGGNGYDCNTHTGHQEGDRFNDHYALDFALSEGTPVAAVAKGVAYIRNDGNTLGKHVWIDHGNGWVSRYAHLQAFKIINGQEVQQGQMIALSGHDGLPSNQDHLHFSLRKNATSSTNGNSYPPDPMSGYSGFGEYGNCTGNASPNYTVKSPGGMWMGPTPDDWGGNWERADKRMSIIPNTEVKLGFDARDNANGGLDYVNLTMWTPSKGWQVLDPPKTKTFGGYVSQAQVFATFVMPHEPAVVSADVGSKNGTFNKSPHGVRHFCTPQECPPEFVAHTGTGTGYGGGGEIVVKDPCAPEYNQVTFFVDSNYSGQCAVKDAGEYNSPEELGIANDSISSIKAGSDAKVQVCDNNGLNSPCQWFDAGTNISDLQTTTIGDNHISSAKILDLTQSVTLCSEPNYMGNCKSWDSGSVDNLALYGLGGTVSSVKVGSKHTLYMYSGENHQGTPSTWDQNVPNLADHSWDNLAKSFKIEPKLDTSCSVPSNANGIVAYHDRDYSPNGGCKLFIADVPDFGAVWHTRISSLKFVGNFVHTKKVTLYTDANYGNVCGVYTINQSDLRACAQQDIVSMKIENYVPPAQAQNISQSAVLDPNTAGNAVDTNLDTEWIGGNKYPIGFSFEPVTIKGITIYDRKQSSTDNNQINKSKVEFSDGTIVDNIDMTSGGPRCAQINFPAKTITWYRVVPIDASGNNGFREIETWDTNGEITSECVMKFNVTPQAGEVIPPTTNSQSTTPTSSPTPEPTTTPTPEPTQEATATPEQTQTQPVVFENFQNGSGWELTNSQYATEGDNQFLRMTPNIDAESWRDVGQAALQNYNKIQFRIRTNDANLWADDGSQLYLNQGGRKYYATLRDKVNLTNSDWQTIEIPISEFEQFGFDRNQPFDSLGFKFHYENTTVNIDVDDIVFMH